MLGFKIQYFKILPIGFAVSFKIDIKNYNKKIMRGNLLVLKKVITAFAGPFVNLFIIFFFIIIHINNHIIIYANFMIFLFNMLPIYPLDGGRILKNLIHLFLGKLNSLIVIKIISNIFIIIFSILVIYLSVITRNLSYIIILIYLNIINLKENKVLKMKIKMYKYLLELE